MTSLDLLPVELLQEILEDCDPKSVANLSLTCRILYELVYKTPNTKLWRTLFLSVPFDDPCKCLKPSGEPLARNPDDFDWKGELQRRIRAQTAIWYPDYYMNEKELATILSTLVSMIQHTPPATPFANIEELSKNIAWLLMVNGVGPSGRYLHSFIEGLHASREHLSEENQQLLAQLHTYVGLTTQDVSVESIVQARAFVYDLRNYTEANYYGPLYPDGSGKVNWVHLHHVMHLMSAQLANNRLVPLSLPFCQSHIEHPEGKFGHDDWAGVEGEWNCSFCYIDHRDLLAFNAQELRSDGTRDTALFELGDFYEAFRVINVHFSVKEVIPNPDYPLRPTLKFKGDIEGIQTMVGEVAMTKDQAIRWHFTSGEEQNMIWSSEGVQIANVQSGYGILGTWTTVFHEEGDPVGPFWLHRLHERSTTGAIDVEERT